MWIDKISARLDFVKRKGLSLDDEMVIDSLAMNLGQIGEQLSAGRLVIIVKLLKSIMLLYSNSFIVTFRVE